MELIKHTIQWLKGEIFEGKMILLFGLLLLILTFCFWKFGTTTNAKAIIFPLLLLSLLHIGTGVSMITNNINRQSKYIELHRENVEKFRQDELKRTESFIKLYPMIRYFSIAFIITGILLFTLLPSPTWKSIGLCVIILGFSLIIIDYFSEERALLYHKVLLDSD